MGRYNRGLRLDDMTIKRLDAPPPPVVPDEGLWRWHTVLGLDLGQASDYSAMAALTKKAYHPDWDSQVKMRLAKIQDEGQRKVEAAKYVKDPSCNLIRLQRWPLKTSYLQIVEDVLHVCLKSQAAMLVVDMGGPGRPVVDLLRQQAEIRRVNTRIRPVSIVASNASMRMHKEARGSYWTVPKVDLVTAAAVLMQGGNLVTPNKADPMIKLLIKEMRSFRMRQSPSGRTNQFEARQGEHDDVVLAFSLACWWMMRFGTRELAVVSGPEGAF